MVSNSYLYKHTDDKVLDLNLDRVSQKRIMEESGFVFRSPDALPYGSLEIGKDEITTKCLDQLGCGGN